jgi:beta-N-acetylhexosaminidase
MVDLQGPEIQKEEIEILNHPHVGAVLLFSRNFSNAAQFQQLTTAIRKISPDVFIAIDHEGGYIQRLQRHGLRAIPAARIYGEIYDENPDIGISFTKKYGEIMARDLLQCGIDLSLAPVLDLHGISNIIGGLDRAFHADPKAVVQLASAFIAGMNAAGMPAVGKHFPGHGSISADSHVEKPVSTASFEELKAHDLRPFIDLIKTDALAGIMPAHVTYANIDPKNPAGFSSIWLKDILRDQLNFTGMVISDCLGMVGADIGDLNTRAQQALNAGCDMLIVCNQPRPALLDLLNNIVINPASESMGRIANFRNKLAYFSGKPIETRHFVEAPPMQTEAASKANSINNTLSV